MNYKMIRFVISWVLKVEGMLMLLPALVGAMYQEKAGFAYLIWGLLCIAAGLILCFRKPSNMEIYSRDGFVCVSLSWVVLGVFGAVPFVITGEIPFYINALFEIVSGFTTTGASILSDVEALSHASLFWRSFSHWIGGMGVLVFILALLPMKGGSVMNLMKAESPGPSVSKLVPKVQQTAKILYSIYIGMTLLQIVLLLIGNIPLFDTLCIAFGTAGTGGFGIRNDSMGSYSTYCQIVTTIFMILFGVNFSAYYLILTKKIRQALKFEEVRYYFGIIAAAILVIGLNTMHLFQNLGVSIQQAAFQVGSIITTTGFSSADFNQWPALSKTILVLLMFVGACAGSTGGGIKVSRILILCKAAKKEFQLYLHPNAVKKIKMDQKTITHDILRSTNIYLTLYLLIFAVSILLISLDNFDMTTNFTAVTATLNNIGPGLEIVGPMGNFSSFSYFSKCVLVFDMLAGRLELFPLIILFTPSIWKDLVTKKVSERKMRRIRRG